MPPLDGPPLLSGGDDDAVSVDVLLLSRKRLPTFLPPGSSEVLAAENVTLDVEKHERQRLNASIVKEDCVPRREGGEDHQ